MSAARDYGRSRAGERPIELELSVGRRRERVPLAAGGYLDQPAALTLDVDICERVADAYAAYAKAPPGGKATWMSANQAHAGVIDWCEAYLT